MNAMNIREPDQRAPDDKISTQPWKQYTGNRDGTRNVA